MNEAQLSARLPWPLRGLEEEVLAAALLLLPP